jgi:hypothetical protein
MEIEKVSISDTPNDCIERSRVFQKAIEGAAILVSESSSALCAKFDYFRELSFALLVRTTLCKQGQPGLGSKSTGDRISLIATFIQGANCTKYLIVNGYHSKAAAALKQDFELLTRVREIQEGAAKAGRTPNVRHAPTGSQRIYGGLNDLAHPSNEGLILRHLRQLNPNGVFGINPLPTFIERTVDVHYWIHVWLTFEFSRESVKLLADNYGWEDEQVSDCAARFAVVQNQGIACGVLKITNQSS